MQKVEIVFGKTERRTTGGTTALCLSMEPTTLFSSNLETQSHGCVINLPKSWVFGMKLESVFSLVILFGFLDPFPVVIGPDISIFCFALKHMLEPGERVEADDGYIGEDPLSVKVPRSMVHLQEDATLYIRTNV